MLVSKVYVYTRIGFFLCKYLCGTTGQDIVLLSLNNSLLFQDLYILL